MSYVLTVIITVFLICGSQLYLDEQKSVIDIEDSSFCLFMLSILALIGVVFYALGAHFGL